MSFTSDIPASGQTLGASRAQILNNFASLRDTISAGSGTPTTGDTPNHVDVNNGSGLGAGKHIFVEMPNVVPSALTQTLNHEGALFTQSKTTGSELFYCRDTASVTDPANLFQMSGPVTAAANGLTMLFGGIILQWGTQTISGAGTVTFASPFPNNVFCLVAKAIGGSVNFTYNAPTLTDFTCNASSSSVIYFIAIGN
jgi:hypothetical protein